VGAVERAVKATLGEHFSCRFAQCDITRAVQDAQNHELFSALPRTRLLIASYVVAENAVALERSNFAFFETALREASPGTLMLVLETTHRSFPAILEAAHRGAEADGTSVQVAVPWVGSNDGFSLLLIKSAECVGDGEGGDECAISVEEQIEKFRRDAKMHEVSTKRGHTVDKP
jgi:hypothetical protein